MVGATITQVTRSGRPSFAQGGFFSASIAAALSIVLLAQDAPRAPLAPHIESSDGAVSPARSPRNANYTIEAHLDPDEHALRASEAIVWRNITSKPTSELRFHAYWNAWRDAKSSFLRERARTDPATHEDDEFARLDITSLTVAFDAAAGSAPHDLTSAISFAAPDDGNADDRTVMVVPLPSAVAPGESVSIRLSWQARVPRPFDRTGVIGNFYFLAQWFPKLGVLEEGGWNCHQFHATTEFFADFGVYDVAMTVPRDWIVGATGVERSRVDNGDGTTTHRYYQEDVHDFAWTTSPEFIEQVATFEPVDRADRAPHGRQSPVVIRLLILPEHRSQAARHITATRTALDQYSTWFGEYPYDHITVVDPAYQSGADGMEYPTLITAGTSWLVPRELTVSTPEEVTIHETGHQWFYGMVASNEFEDAWMDEGVNTYASVRAMLDRDVKSYYERRFFGGFVPWVVRDLELARETTWDRLPGYRRTPKSDIPTTPSYRYSPVGRIITYNKTALWLNTLERMLGWPVVQRSLATFFERWQFKHPKPDDFFAIVNEVSGQDLTWFFDQVHRSSNVVDYALESLTSERNGSNFHTEVVVRRNGEVELPVDVRVTFENGEVMTERWDGKDRWTQLALDRPSRAVSAQVDPDRVQLLDVNYTNNSRALAPRTSEAATKWSLKWMAWLQDALLSWAFLV